MLTPLLKPDESSLDYFRRLMYPEGTDQPWRLGHFYDVVLGLDDEPSMTAYAEGYISDLVLRHGKDEGEATKIALANIGYAQGEGNTAERRRMWFRATGAAHPIFGLLIPTPEQALEAGRALGEESRRKAEPG